MILEKIYKEASYFIIRSVNTLTSLLKIIVLSRFNIRMPKIKTESCAILGNGPSLKTSLEKHKDFFQKHSLICVNMFALTEEYSVLKPEFYVLLDPAFWLSDIKVVTDTLEAIKIKTTWPIQIFIPQLSSKISRFKELPKLNKHVSIVYFNYSIFNGFKLIGHWLFSKNLAMPQSQNVLVAALFLSINLGFKKIYLFGADHTWHENLHVDENNILCIKNLHFYDKEKIIEFIPFKKHTQTDETFKIHEIFTTWGKTFYGYIALENYSKYRSSKIYNASEISFIDAFERKKI